MENNDSKRGSVANLISKFGVPTQGHVLSTQEKGPMGRKWTRPIIIPATEQQVIDDLKSNSQLAIKIDANGSTLAHRACANSQLHVLAQLKSMQYLVPKEDIHGLTCLHLAVKLGRTDVVKYFSENLPEALPWLAKHGQTILHTAVIWNQVELLRLLLPKKELIGSLVDKLGNHLTHYVNTAQVLHVLHELNSLDFSICNKQGLPAIVTFFLQKNTPRDVLKEALKMDQFQHDKNEQGEGLLHLIVKEKRGSMKELIELFNEINNNDKAALNKYVNRLDSNSFSAMHLAASLGDFDAIEELDSLGASFDVRTHDGRSIIQVALQYVQLECTLKIMAYFPELLTAVDNDGHSVLRYALDVQLDKLVPLLIKEGLPIDIDLDKKTLETILHYIINARGRGVELIKSVINLDEERARKLLQARDRNGLTPLHLAVKLCYADLAEEIIQYDSTNNIDNDGNTLYHTAWTSNNPKYLKQVLQLLDMHVKSIQRDQTNSSGELSIDIAARHSDEEMTDLFIQFYKACAFGRDSTPFMNGRNLAHVASTMNSKKVMSFAVREGVSLNVKDTHGKLPIDFAIEKGHAKAFELIIRESIRANAISFSDFPRLVSAIIAVEQWQLFEVLAEENLLPAELVIKGKPAIIFFSELGLYASVNNLLSLGVDPNTTFNASSCLHLSVANMHVEVARVLLTYGANPNIDPTARGNTPLKLVADKFFCPTAVATDESHPRWKEVGDLLLGHGADPTLDSQSGSPILMAQMAMRVFQNYTLSTMLLGYTRALTLDVFAEFFPFLGVTGNPQTVSIVRKNIVDYLVQLFFTMSSSQILSPLILSFIGEDGIDGGGLKSEAFSLFFKELMSSERRLFESYNNAPYLPQAMKDEHQHLSDEEKKVYYTIGRIMFRVAIVDRIPIGVQFPNFFFRYLKKGAEAKFSLADLKHFDADLFKGVSAVLHLDLPVNSTMIDWDFEDGSDHAEYVTNENKSDYVNRKVRYTLIGSRIEAMESIRDGFFDTNYNYKLVVSCDESLLRLLICGREIIDTKQLISAIEFSRFDTDSKTPNLCLDLIEEFDAEQKRKFLHYITGLNTLPTKIDKKIMITKFDSIQALPISSTCGWTLYLPDYGDKEVILAKLQYAWEEAYAAGFTRV